MTEKTKTQRPTAPEELDGEALLEWGRISDELDALGMLDKVDRGIMVIHCQTWAVYRQCTEAVQRFGAVIKWPNGVPGPGPFYKVMKETANMLRSTFGDLGLTPAARNFKAKTEDEGDLDL
jgi:P27 family predicted phage terminase small subunit